MIDNKFNSKLGFVLSAIGGAVGLGNIWMFPYKLQKYGGLFLYTYLLLTFTVGIVLLSLEFILGKYFMCDVPRLYKIHAPKIKCVGLLTVLSPLIILMYYCAAGGMCIKYFFINFFEFFWIDDSFFSYGLTFISTIVFVLLIYIIASKDLNKGIERFNIIMVPLLMVAIFIWAAILIIRDNSNMILKEIFFIKNEYGIKQVLEIFAVSAEQMFFSLSIAVGSMITYGAMMPANQNTIKSALSVAVSDTLFALAMSVVVISSSISGFSDANGPQLIFNSMQVIFENQGRIGNLLGIFFYAAVLIAAITSAVSYVEVPISALKNISTLNRKGTLCICIGIVIIPAIYITVENFEAVYNVIVFVSEGVLVPLTAFLTALNFGALEGKYVIKGFLACEVQCGYVKKAFIFILNYLIEFVVITVIIAQIIVYINIC